MGVNLLLLGSAPPGGTGRYAVCLFEALVELATRYPDHLSVHGIGIEAARAYFSPAACTLIETVSGGGAVRRAWNELAALPRLARRKKIDILLNPSFYGAITGTPRRAVVIHDMYFRKAPKAMLPRRRWALRAFVPLVAMCSERVLTDSQATQDALASFYPHLAARAVVVHAASPFAPSQGASVAPAVPWPYILLVGHLTLNKRADVAVAAIQELRAEGLSVGLVHVGDDLGRLAGQSPAHGILAVGRQSDAVLASLYRGAVATIVPSTDEGFGLPVLEAQALGSPVIAADRGALPEVGGEGALYFDVDDVRACAEAVRRVVTDARLRDRLIEAGDRNRRRFSWERTARGVLAALAIELPADERSGGDAA